VYYAPGLGPGGLGTSQRPAWNPAIPLSARAVQNGATLTHDYGMDFVAIGRRNGNGSLSGLNNAGYVAGQVPNDGEAAGRGRVTEAYRIGRTEVPTAVWTDFYNAASYVGATQGVIPFVQLPSGWGATESPTYTGPGRRWEMATAPGINVHMNPVGGISWRTAAILCNWLHNDRALTREAFMGGAYEVSTFGTLAEAGPLRFTDQVTRSAGARYWIPAHDQWLAAAHYDPSRVDPTTGQPGSYWQYSTTSDTAPIYEPPENGGQANAGFNRGGRAYTIALGDYPTVQSPWGLLDTAGGSSEWTEGVITFETQTVPSFRISDGSARGDSPFAADQFISWSGDWPGLPDWTYGLRLAAAIPSPSTSVLLVFTACMFACRRRA
jgi:hypothetical protein